MDSLTPTEPTWDPDQKLVITASSSDRLIVEAGPGTGKTAVACARLAHLIAEDDLEPSKTWMISFTRTAVAEIRARLHSYVGDASFAIRIATVDSHAWSIHSGHDPDARLTGSYEQNIERVTTLLKTDEAVADELARIEHVIIDEAQDLVGQRADLIEALISRLSPECGVTVFADEAQAIYGFSDDGQEIRKGQTARAKTSLLERLRKLRTRFKTLTLKKIYRTSSPGLHRIFSDVRRNLLNPKNQKFGLHAETSASIREFSDRNDLKWAKTKIADFTAQDLLLFRTRAEVLMASQFCDMPHRLRLSGYGITLPAWLSICFFDFFDSFISERAFLDLWSKRIEGKLATEYGPGEAWERMVRLAGRGDGSIDLQKLRRRLGQARPPVEMALTEFGLLGPIVGTIHASKGREAANVVLLLPKVKEFENEKAEAEEARVMFVGATRARESLLVGDGIHYPGSTLPSGRVFRSKSGSAMVEIGRLGDVTASGLVGRSIFSKEQALVGQECLSASADIVTKYRLQSDSSLEWRYRIMTQDGARCLGAISQNLTSDLWEILQLQKQNKTRRPPGSVNHVRALGCSSLVLPSDSPELEALNEPWSATGFVLAPRFAALPSFFFAER